MRIKKIISLLLAVVMIAGVLPMSASALSTNDVATIIDATEDVVKTISKLSAEEIDAADLIKTTAEQFVTEEAVDVLKEVLDNGTDIFVGGTDLRAVAEKLGIKLVESGDEDLLFGGYISAYNGKYLLTQLCAYLDPEDAADPAVANKFKSADFEKYVDFEQLIADNTKSEAAAADAGDSSVAKLQIDSAPMVSRGTKALYWFKKGNASGVNATYCLQDSAAYKEIEGWSIIATLRMDFCSYYCGYDKSGGYYTYTTCTFTVAPRVGEDKKVKEYSCSMYDNTEMSTIVDYTRLSNKSGVVYAEYKKPMTITSTNSNTGDSLLEIHYEYPVTEYSYKPNCDQDFSEDPYPDGEEKIIWTATPKDPKADAEYRIKPGIMSRATKDSAVIVYFRFERVQLGGSIRPSYSIDENTNYRGQANPVYVTGIYWEDVEPYV